jgi:hypothetical protein
LQASQTPSGTAQCSHGLELKTAEQRQAIEFCFAGGNGSPDRRTTHRRKGDLLDAFATVTTRLSCRCRKLAGSRWTDGCAEVDKVVARVYATPPSVSLGSPRRCSNSAINNEMGGYA